MMSGDSVFATPLDRYMLQLEVFEGVTAYLASLATALENGVNVFRDPSRLANRDDPAWGTLWPSTDDMNALIVQWHLCLSDVWHTWNLLPAEQQATVRTPSHRLFSIDRPVFRVR